MRPKRQQRARRPQRDVLSQEILDTLLGFIRSHWYQDATPAEFLKARPRLLEWVVFEAAGRLDGACLTLPGARYLEIHLEILREALTHGGRPTYIPAYLRHVVQSHWRIHWERYYEEAKAVTPRIEECLRDLAAGVGKKPDPVRDLAQAKQLLAVQRRSRSTERAATRSAAKSQLELF
jgi:hypothetical protein